MKVLVCGDRDWEDAGGVVDKVLSSIHYGWIGSMHRGCIELLIEGGAPGADSDARDWAHAQRIEVKTVKAEWTKFGKAAGPIRNKQMLKSKPNLVVAFHSNIAKSKGTKNMLAQAKKAGILTILVS